MSISATRPSLWKLAGLLVLCLMAGCSDDTGLETASDGDVEQLDGDVDTVPDGDADANMDPDLDEDPESEVTVGEILIRAISILENPDNHLSATVSFETDVKTETRIIAESSDGHRFSTPKLGPPAKSHYAPLLGLRAGRDYTLTIKASDKDGNYSLSEPQSFSTAPLSDDFPPISVTRSMPELMQPGVTLFSTYRWAPETDHEWSMLIAVDEAGEVVWYHKPTLITLPLRHLNNGKLLYNYANLVIRQIDMMGEELASFNAIAQGLDSYHHDVVDLPDGHFLTLSTELKEVDGYPKEGGGTETYQVVSDLIVELDGDGQLIRSTPLFGLLDPLHMGVGFHDPFWAINYLTTENVKDWSHSNSLIYQAEDDSFIVSVRHFNRLLKFDRASGDLIWEMGPGGDFSMLDDGRWHYHQHAPKRLENGHLLLYDNGNTRDGLEPGELPHTRVVEYAVDESNMSVEQVWEYRGEQPYFAQFVGDVNRLANGNTLIVDGGLLEDPSVSVYELDNRKWSRIVEVSAEKPNEVVFEMIIRDKPDSPIGYCIFRGMRLPSLYPLKGR